MNSGAFVEQIRTLECGLLHDRQTRASLEARLDPDFEEVGPGGVVTSRAQVMRWLLEIKRPDERWTLDDFEVMRLSDDVASARYRARRQGSASAGSLRVSLWRRGADMEWRLVFHQATPLGAPERG